MEHTEGVRGRDRRDRADVRGDTFVRRVLQATAIIAVVVAALLVLWLAADVFFLLFAGVLVANLLRSLADWVGGHTPLSAGWALAAVGLAVLVLCGGAGWLLAPHIAAQADQLVETLPRAVEQVQAQIRRFSWGERLLEQAPSQEGLVRVGRDRFGVAAGLFSSVLGALADVVIVLVVGLYLAAAPGTYVEGLVRLVPLDHRQRFRAVLGATGHTLRRWLIGRLVGMLVIGVATTAGLWLLGVPLALALGVLAALLTFIPTVGPALALVPAVLLALLQGPAQALSVLTLYLGIQPVESYALTPLVQQHTVSLPPVLTIVSLALFGVLFGTLGLALAAALVAVRMLYVESVLGDWGDPAPPRGADDGGSSAPAPDAGGASTARRRRGWGDAVP